MKEAPITRREKGNNRSIRLRHSLLPVSSLRSHFAEVTRYPLGLRETGAESSAILCEAFFVSISLCN